MLITMNSVVAGCAALAVLLLSWVWLQQKLARRVAIFESQLIDALGLAARSLRAGHPLPGSFRMIAQEIPPPIGKVFADICQQQDLGVGLDFALRKAADDYASPDLKLFATSIIIQLHSGGNLADMMERLAEVVRDRMRLARRVRVLLAQSQLSKYILLALPFVMFLILNLLSPEFMKPLYTTPLGHRLLLIAAGGLLIGAWVMNRLSIIRY
jgi:tight adherence protein B